MQRELQFKFPEQESPVPVLPEPAILSFFSLYFGVVDFLGGVCVEKDIDRRKST